MGVVVDGSTPANPSGPVSWLDTILGSAGNLGDGFAAGFQALLDGVGQVLQGATQAVGAVFNGIVQGVTNMIGWIGHAIGSIFGRTSAPKPEETPPPPIFSPIQSNLEAVLEPYFTTIDLLQDEVDTLESQVSDLNTDLSNANTTISDLNDDLVEGLNPENPYSPLFLIQADINDQQTIINDQQRQINELVQEQLNLHEEMIAALRDAQESQIQSIARVLPIPRDTPIEDDYFLVTYTPGDAHKWRVTAKGTWVGTYVWQSIYTGSGAGALDVREVGATRTRDEGAYNRHQSIITYWVQPGVQKFADVNSSSTITIDQSSWHAFRTYTVEEPADDYLLSSTFRMPNVNYLDSFGHRISILRNGSVIELYKWGPRNNVGPTFGDGAIRWRKTLNNVTLAAGDVVRFEAYSNAPNPVNRRISDFDTKISWTSQPEV